MYEQARSRLYFSPKYEKKKKKEEKRSKGEGEKEGRGKKKGGGSALLTCSREVTREEQEPAAGGKI